MKLAALAFLLLTLSACRQASQVTATGTISPEAEGRRQTEGARASDTALSGTFGGDAPGQAPGQPAASGTHPGATGTDATTLTDPNVSTTGAPPNRTAT